MSNGIKSTLILIYAVFSMFAALAAFCNKGLVWEIITIANVTLLIFSPILIELYEKRNK